MSTTPNKIKFHGSLYVRAYTSAPTLELAFVDAVKKYVGKLPTKVEVFQDRTTNTYAIRAQFKFFPTHDFLYKGKVVGKADPDFLEEVDFASWPPVSGKYISKAFSPTWGLTPVYPRRVRPELAVPMAASTKPPDKIKVHGKIYVKVEAVTKHKKCPKGQRWSESKRRCIKLTPAQVRKMKMRAKAHPARRRVK